MKKKLLADSAILLLIVMTLLSIRALTRHASCDHDTTTASAGGTVTNYIGVFIKDINTPLVLYTMPCGHKAVLMPGQAVPTEDVPCPCANSSHWLWKVGK